jgi:hypothetical protein
MTQRTELARSQEEESLAPFLPTQRRKATADACDATSVDETRLCGAWCHTIDDLGGNWRARRLAGPGVTTIPSFGVTKACARPFAARANTLAAL